MEYYPLHFEKSLAAICRYPVDYLILGQHIRFRFLGAQFVLTALCSIHGVSSPK